MALKNSKAGNSEITKKKGDEGEYYLDLSADEKIELEVAQRQMANGRYLTMHDLDNKVKLWLSEK